MTTRTRLHVVDDERDILAIFEAIGKRLDMEVRCWDHPVSFLDEVDCCRHGTTEILVLDLLLPDMDGVEVLRRLARKGCRMSVLFITGTAPKVLKVVTELGKLHGMRVVGGLRKPFSVADAMHLLSQAKSLRPSDGVGGDGREATEVELVNALAAGEIRPHYQPQVGLATGEVVGFEALARWHDPDGNVLGPGLFLPLVDRYGLHQQLLETMVRAGLRDLAAWREALGPKRISFNLDASILTDLDLPAKLEGWCREAGIPPGLVLFEVTEGSMLEFPEVALDILARLALHGFELAIDDFGTGYATHEQLRRLPFDELKVDRSFVTDCIDNEESQVILSSMIDLGRQLGLRVLVEGVETVEELAFVRGCGCFAVQGYHFSPPVAASEVPGLATAISAGAGPR